ncbi:MAG: F0F1 ATP synthase subunit delta [Proteobacteria bacterium]|nr:F0F1 ATP synthase subunit delta [Pseudomonadota bacterium]MBW3616729.1 F0F1 ATP synthase subunit delta [Pseudomonadota bacterium]
MADDSQNNVGGRYAQALFDLASDADGIAAVEADLNTLRAMRVESPDLRRLLDSPVFDAADRSRALNALAERAGFQPLTRKFLGLLAANRRTSSLPQVIAGFRRLSAERRGAVEAEVVTAVPLTDAQRDSLAAALGQSLGKAPEVTLRVDPAILGGIKIKVGSRLFDASIKSRLDQLKFALQRA